MSLQLQCRDGKGDTKSVDLTTAKPVRARCKDGHSREAVLHFQCDAKDLLRCQVRVEGEGMVELDGMAVQEADLVAGSQLTIGRHVFTIVAPNDGRLPADVANAHHFSQPCSNCGASFSVEDCRNAWVDGNYRICLKCLAKGVRPQHLPQWRHSLDVDVDAPTDEIPPPGQSPVGGVSAADSAESAATDAYTAPAVPPQTQPLESARSPSGPRSRRRISASSISAVEAPPSNGGGGIIGKVTRVFRRRGADDDEAERDRLQELEDQRTALLIQAGRASLTARTGLGLPPDVLARLGRGETVSLSLADCDRPQVEAWRARQRQLAHFDAEIAAIRQSLGVVEESAAGVGQVTLRTEESALENRAFLASDALLTEDLGGQYDESQEGETEAYTKPPASADVPAHGAGNSARRPHVRRRRR